MKQLLIVPAFTLAAIALASPAHAQLGGSNRPAYANELRYSSYESRRVAYDTGYREGLKVGEKDGRRRAGFNYQNQRTWQRADKGYHRTFGDLERYRQSFRTGYAAGYTDGYRRFAPGYAYNSRTGRAVPRTPVPYGAQTSGRYQIPGQYGYNPAFNAAYSNGLNDGYEKGRQDARGRNAYDPLRHKWYRSGDRHYRSQYGSRVQYRNIYREGFKDGYDRGYREGIYRR